jgi:putative transposase
MEFYHVLNRGVEKRKIFMDNKDYYRFIHDLHEFNMKGRVDTNHRFNSPQNTDIGCPYSGEGGDVGNDERLVDIHFFCLMPNHYHLLISPLVEGGVSLFMKKMNMGYAKYFNERYERTGSLFQGKYKSVHVVDEAHFMYLPYYIHLNPLDLSVPTWRERTIPNLDTVLTLLQKYRWSSHLDYLGKKNFPSVTNRAFFLDYYNGTDGYIKSLKKFLETFDYTSLKPISLE